MTDQYTEAIPNEPVEGAANTDAASEASIPVPLVVLVLSPFILASLIKPRFLDPELQPTEIHINVGSLWSGVMGLIIIFVTIITVYALATRHNSVEEAKVFFILLSLVVATFAWIIVNHHSYLMWELETMEANASESRDQTRQIIRSAKGAMEQLNRKLGSTTEEEIVSASQVLKSFGPLAMMFLQGERNIFKIGIAAAGVANKAFSLFNSPKHK
jgi:hypothetical protein